jgi:hypothetical protein
LGFTDAQERAGFLNGREIESPRERLKVFLDSQGAFLNSLSRQEWSRFNLSPEKLARIRREAGASAGGGG